MLFFRVYLVFSLLLNLFIIIFFLNILCEDNYNYCIFLHILLDYIANHCAECLRIGGRNCKLGSLSTWFVWEVMCLPAQNLCLAMGSFLYFPCRVYSHIMQICSIILYKCSTLSDTLYPSLYQCKQGRVTGGGGYLSPRVRCGPTAHISRGEIRRN